MNRFHRQVRKGAVVLGLLVAVTGPVLAQAHTNKAPAPAAPALLPASFADLHQVAPPTTEAGAQASAAEPARAALLREDGLLDAAQATYTGGGGTAMVRAYRFADATGAFAAFTAFREPGMRTEPLGTDGSSEGSRHLFWTGATLIDATVPGASQPHALETLKALAGSLPKPRGSASIPPPLRGYLPTAGLQAETVHYAIGAAGYAAAGEAAHDGAPLPQSVIDFSRDAEVATARYRTGRESGWLLLLEYPTPQMAGGRRQAITALLKSGATALPVGDPGVIVEQIGPLVALTSGGWSEAGAHALIRGVHYEAAVTINHPEGYVSEVSKAAKLLLGIAYMVIILFVAAVLLALFLGGGRVLIRRMRGKPDSSLNDEDFISLKIG